MKPLTIVTLLLVLAGLSGCNSATTRYGGYPRLSTLQEDPYLERSLRGRIGAWAGDAARPDLKQEQVYRY